MVKPSEQTIPGGNVQSHKLGERYLLFALIVDLKAYFRSCNGANSDLFLFNKTWHRNTTFALDMLFCRCKDQINIFFLQHVTISKVHDFDNATVPFGGGGGIHYRLHSHFTWCTVEMFVREHVKTDWNIYKTRLEKYWLPTSLPCINISIPNVWCASKPTIKHLSEVNLARFRDLKRVTFWLGNIYGG